MIVIEHERDAPQDRPWWFLLWEKADALVAMDERITVPRTTDVPFLLHRDAAAGIDFNTYPYGRGLRELALGLLVAFIPPRSRTATASTIPTDVPCSRSAPRSSGSRRSTTWRPPGPCR